ncbi:hypothetical protein RX06_03076 [Escherichia coli]|nr:hypothetical protein RX06_03076 [Escherichia coli]
MFNFFVFTFQYLQIQFKIFLAFKITKNNYKLNELLEKNECLNKNNTTFKLQSLTTVE